MVHTDQFVITVAHACLLVWEVFGVNANILGLARPVKSVSTLLLSLNVSFDALLLETCGHGGLICLNSGTCLLDGSDQGTPICQCPVGFAGDDCSAVACGSDGGACFNGGRCNETTGTCVCPPPLTSDDCRGSRYHLLHCWRLRVHLYQMYAVLEQRLPLSVRMMAFVS